MLEKNINADTAKELLTIISYCDNEFIDSIPDYVLQNLNNLASTSTKDFYIDKNKSLIEQNISEDCKDLLSIIYFTYMTDLSSKNEILNIWIQNEKQNSIDF